MLSKDVFGQLGAELGRRQKRASVTKEAFPGGNFMRGLGKLITKPVMRNIPGTMPGTTSLVPGRAFSPLRTAATGVVGAGAIGHASNAIGDAMGDPSDRYFAAKQQYEGMLPAQMEKIHAREHYEAHPDYEHWTNRLGRKIPGMAGSSADELKQQVREGNFGGSAASLGGWNPFATQKARHYENAAGSAANEMNQRYSKLIDRPDPETLQKQLMSLQQEMATSPFQGHRQMLASEMQRIQQKMTANPVESQEAKFLRNRMITMGMADPMKQFAEPRDLPSSQSPFSGSGMPDYSRLAGGDFSAKPGDFSVRPSVAGFY